MSDKHYSADPLPGVVGIYTETLARLYLQQGLYDQALAIYRHLLRMQPENQAWREKITVLEQQRTIAAVRPQVPGENVESLESASPLACRRRLQKVIARLECWLAQLRRQREN